jgi:tetratricopeptide (TPR) repeat protein
MGQGTEKVCLPVRPRRHSFAAMFASLLTYFTGLEFLGVWSVIWLLLAAFQIWMFIDAIRRGEWIWAVFIWFFPGINALLYYFFIYRSSPSAMSGFELPGAHKRKRIKELQAQIYHLDKAHHHSQLGDIYFQQGKLEKAETCYRAALERDPQDLDTRAHLGQCLLRQKRAAEARPLLEGVVAENPKHDYGYTLMALAETMTALGEADAALQIWQQVTAEHSYARAKVQLAELYIAQNQPDLARTELKDVVSDDLHAPAFQRKRDRIWVRRAKSLMGN